MSRRDPRAFVREHKVLLISLFALFLLGGLWFGNLAAMAGGVAGLGWVYTMLKVKE